MMMLPMAMMMMMMVAVVVVGIMMLMLQARAFPGSMTVLNFHPHFLFLNTRSTSPAKLVAATRGRPENCSKGERRVKPLP